MPCSPTPLCLSAAFGFITGGRSATGIAALLAGSKLGPAAALGAGGELVADKLPFTPSRLMPPSALLRLGVGAFNGVLIARRTRANPIACAVVGAGAAGAGSVLGVQWRQLAAKGFGKDIYGALVEDAVVIATTAVATRALRKL